MPDDATRLENHRVVSHGDWLDARTMLLAREKEFTRLRDELSRARRELPWEAVTKEYAFDGPDGRESLNDLFDGRSQLVVYHFMFDPDWHAGCPHCSHWADSFNGAIVHLNQRDVSMVAISRAPYPKLESYRRRMGWTFKWLSAFENDFNFDLGVTFTPEEVASKQAFYNFARQDPHNSQREGISVFYRDASRHVFHTYSTYARGIDPMSVDYQFLDLVPKGRDESGRGPYWVRRHDEYGSKSRG
jgi:predicted dithiol-disulfide oxidoreductase (DUF899 family)